MVDRRYSGRYTKDCVVLHLSPVWNHTPAARNCALAPRSLATSETSEMSRSGSIGLGEAVEMYASFLLGTYYSSAGSCPGAADLVAHTPTKPPWLPGSSVWVSGPHTPLEFERVGEWVGCVARTHERFECWFTDDRGSVTFHSLFAPLIRNNRKSGSSPGCMRTLCICSPWGPDSCPGRPTSY